jgi:hypothetical protein
MWLRKNGVKCDAGGYATSIAEVKLFGLRLRRPKHLFE